MTGTAATTAIFADVPAFGTVGRDVTPQMTRNGDVLIDVTYVVLETGMGAPNKEVGYHTTRTEARGHVEELEKSGVASFYRRETITMTPDEYADTEFCRANDC